MSTVQRSSSPAAFIPAPSPMQAFSAHKALYPTVELGSLKRASNADAYAKDASCRPPQLRPDHRLHGVAQLLAKPSTQTLSHDDLLRTLQQEAICPIDMQVFNNPVLVADGHTYSLKAISHWWKCQAEQQQPFTSPLTNEKLYDLSLIPNTAMRALMADMGITQAHSRHPNYYDVPQSAAVLTQRVSNQLRPLNIAVRPSAPEAFAASDRSSQNLHVLLRRKPSLLQNLRLQRAIDKAQADAHALFTSPACAHADLPSKLLRVIDVKLQSGDEAQAATYLRAGLATFADDQSLLVRLAMLEAKHKNFSRAQVALSNLFGCAYAEADVLRELSKITCAAADPEPSLWPVYAVHGLLLLNMHEDEAGRTLMRMAAHRFGSRLLSDWL